MVVHQYVFATNFVKEKKYEKTEKNKRGNSDISEEKKMTYMLREV